MTAHLASLLGTAPPTEGAALVCSRLTAPLGLRWALVTRGHRVLAAEGPAPVDGVVSGRGGTDIHRVTVLDDPPVLLTVLPADPAAWRPADTDLLHTVAGQLADVFRRDELAALLADERERLRTERSMRHAVHARLRRSEETTRARLARELHDGALQSILRSASLLGAARDPLPELAALVAEAGRELRAVCRELHPAVVDHLGLAEALRAGVARLAREAGADVAVRFANRSVVPPGTLTGSAEAALYRIATEAATNAVRHAGADRITVELRFDDPLTTVEVTDDGVGFGADALHLGGLIGSGHLGVAGMFERAAEFGGVCAVTPRSGGGTTVRVSVPPSPRNARRRTEPERAVAHA